MNGLIEVLKGNDMSVFRLNDSWGRVRNQIDLDDGVVFNERLDRRSEGLCPRDTVRLRVFLNGNTNCWGSPEARLNALITDSGFQATNEVRRFVQEQQAIYQRAQVSPVFRPRPRFP